MKALWLENGELRLETGIAAPKAESSEALIEVVSAGICSTDAALMDGMYGFSGIPGHEFVGRVASGPEAMLGRRVVGEINVACGTCPTCLIGRRKHCAKREAIGIRGRNGAFAQYLTLPLENLHPVPDAVPDDAAVFAEPLAAALNVLEHVEVTTSERVLVIGDGKLGQLVCRVLALEGARVDVLGRHRRKLERLRGVVARALDVEEAPQRCYDFAVECSGSVEGLALAMDALRPCGTLVMKSTVPRLAEVDATRLVVDELHLVGSRCGPFDRALELLATKRIDPRPLIDARYPLDDGVAALGRSRDPGTLKVLLDMEI